MKKIQVPTEWGAKAFGVLLEHGIVRSVLPLDPPTYKILSENGDPRLYIEALLEALGFRLSVTAKEPKVA